VQGNIWYLQPFYHYLIMDSPDSTNFWFNWSRLS